MTRWRNSLKKSIVSPAQLADKFSIDPTELEDVVSLYPMRVNPYYFNLIKEKGDPIWRQAIPDTEELNDTESMEDPA